MQNLTYKNNQKLQENSSSKYLNLQKQINKEDHLLTARNSSQKKYDQPQLLTQRNNSNNLGDQINRYRSQSPLNERQLQKNNQIQSNQQTTYIQQYQKFKDQNKNLQSRLLQTENQLPANNYQDQLIQNYQFLMKENENLIKNNEQLETHLQKKNYNISENIKSIQLQYENEKIDQLITEYNKDIQVWEHRYVELQENMERLQQNPNNQKNTNISQVQQNIQHLITENNLLNKYLSDKLDNIEISNINYQKQNKELTQDKQALTNTLRKFTNDCLVWKSKYKDLETQFNIINTPTNDQFLKQQFQYENQLEILMNENDKLIEQINQKNKYTIAQIKSKKIQEDIFI